MKWIRCKSIKQKRKSVRRKSVRHKSVRHKSVRRKSVRRKSVRHKSKRIRYNKTDGARGARGSKVDVIDLKEGKEYDVYNKDEYIGHGTLSSKYVDTDSAHDAALSFNQFNAYEENVNFTEMNTFYNHS